MTPQTEQQKNSKHLVQIVPSLPPAVDGIGDYALQLARSLRSEQGIETSFIVCDPGWRSERWTNEFKAARLWEREAWTVPHALGILGMTHAPVLLHFSPYGYAKRGMPFWMADAMERLMGRRPGCVSVAFHELDVEHAPVTSSAFWAPVWQRQILRRLLRLDGFRYTNTGVHRRKLEQWGGGEIALIPNFANMGEVVECPTEERTRKLVIFGRADQRRWTYTHGAEALKHVCNHIGATGILDIGAPIEGHADSEIGGTPIERLGFLDAERLAATMRSAYASFLYYPHELLTKSGGHALACASGTISFVYSGRKPPQSCAGLVEGVDYLPVEQQSALPSIAELDQLRPLIHANYAKRSSRAVSVSIAVEIFDRAQSTSLRSLASTPSPAQLLLFQRSGLAAFPERPRS